MPSGYHTQAAPPYQNPKHTYLFTHIVRYNIYIRIDYIRPYTTRTLLAFVVQHAYSCYKYTTRTLLVILHACLYSTPTRTTRTITLLCLYERNPEGCIQWEGKSVPVGIPSPVHARGKSPRGFNFFGVHTLAASNSTRLNGAGICPRFDVTTSSIRASRFASKWMSSVRRTPSYVRTP